MHLKIVVQTDGQIVFLRNKVPQKKDRSDTDLSCTPHTVFMFFLMMCDKLSIYIQG